MTALATDLAGRLDPVVLARKTSMDPDPWQAQVLRSQETRLLLNCSRQSGKSTVADVRAVHKAVYTSSSRGGPAPSTRHRFTFGWPGPATAPSSSTSATAAAAAWSSAVGAGSWPPPHPTGSTSGAPSSSRPSPNPTPPATSTVSGRSSTSLTTPGRSCWPGWWPPSSRRCPHPIAALIGEQGSGKSTTGRALTRLVDPSPAPLRTTPSEVEDWAVAAAGSWVVGLDNVSGVPDWLSDALCRAVTGDGLVRRRLYSDAHLSVLAYRRVVLLTSIDPGITRGDLLDRLLPVTCHPFPPERRLTDEEIDAAFAAAHPHLLGGLLTLTAAVLDRLPHLRLPALPRMADFARILAAVDGL